MHRACLALLLTVSVAVGACGKGSPGGSATAAPTDPAPAGLRAAAVAWSDAFLTGSVADIESMEGASCRAHVSAQVGAPYLRSIRAAMERFLGRPLESIHPVGVELRNVRAHTGDAQVEYNLPAGLAGNDNWVTYRYEDGQWRETNCHAPIGGESVSSSSSTSGRG
ncbi:MAG TPA: hypothetical protein VKR22_08455 [Acidimicrobiales bacterium]|nr:hypothetical protein [Acidimicrobiales bacterium]